MDIALHGGAWHESLGKLLEALDRPFFWRILAQTLGQFAPRRQLGGPDIQRLQPLDSFLHGRGDRRNRAGPADQSIYNRTHLQDPFYQVSRNCRRGGLFFILRISSPKISKRPSITMRTLRIMW